MKQVTVGSENGECVTEKLSEVVSGWLSFPPPFCSVNTKELFGIPNPELFE